MSYRRGISVDSGRNVLWLYQQAGSNGRSQIIQSNTVSGRVIPGGLSEISIPHSLETASIVPCFTPSWNTAVYPIYIDSLRFAVKFSVSALDKAATLDFDLRRGSSVSVTAGSTSKVITHNLGNADAVILVTPSWNTAIGRTSKLANSLTVDFSVTAPDNAVLYYATHSDEDDLTGEDESVTENAETHAITHNAGVPFLPVFLLTNWKTTYNVVSKGENQTVIKFANTAPSGAKIDWRVKYPYLLLDS